MATRIHSNTEIEGRFPHSAGVLTGEKGAAKYQRRALWQCFISGVVIGKIPLGEPFFQMYRMRTEAKSSVEICILAGGLSQRMGREKSRLKLGDRTMLGHIRTIAKTLGLQVRVIRRDLVARCGPLGGIYTALKTTKADAVLFLACDMPFVTDTLMRTVLSRIGRDDNALFVRSAGKPGFPFVLRRETLPIVCQQIAQGRLSLGELSSGLRSKLFNPPARQRAQLRNINTPEDWARAVRLFERRTG